MRRRSPIWTHHGYDGELVFEADGFSLWKVGRLYYFVRGYACADMIGEFRSDDEAEAAWNELVELWNKACGRG